MSQKVVQWK